MAVSVNAHVKTVENIGDPLITQDGQPIEGIKVKFQLVNFGGTKATSALDALSGEIISNTSTSVITDANGEFSTALWPNNRGDAPTAYYVTFSKGIKPFFILVDEAVDTSLLAAKLAYSVGTGAIAAVGFVTQGDWHPELSWAVDGQADVSFEINNEFTFAKYSTQLKMMTVVLSCQLSESAFAEDLTGRALTINNLPALSAAPRLFIPINDFNTRYNADFIGTVIVCRELLWQYCYVGQTIQFSFSYIAN